MEKFEITPEILHQAAQCETVEEIFTKAKEYGEDITMEQAQRIFELSHAQNGGVSDEELDSVAGGHMNATGCAKEICPYCDYKCLGARVLKEHILKQHPGKSIAFRTWWT